MKIEDVRAILDCDLQIGYTSQIGEKNIARGIILGAFILGEAIKDAAKTIKFGTCRKV